MASVSVAGALGEDEAVLEQKAEALMDTLADPAGSFYRFSMAHSLLTRMRPTPQHAEA